jgi:plastocyanin
VRRAFALVALAVLALAAPAGAAPASGAATAAVAKGERAAPCAKQKRSLRAAKRHGSARQRSRARRRLARCRKAAAGRTPRALTKRPAPAAPAPKAGSPALVPLPEAPLGPVSPSPSGAPAPAPGAPAPAPSCADRSPWLGVTAEDRNGVFRLAVSRTCVPAGQVLVQFINADLSEHNLYAEGTSPKRTRRVVVGDTPGETEADTAKIDLTEGTWRLLCAIDGHESMTRTLSVTR